MKNGKKKEKFIKELSRLSKGFTALNIDHKKGVLKTAQGLLEIQKMHRGMVVEGTGYSVFSKCKNQECLR